MSTKQPITALSHQKKTQNTADRRETGEDASKLAKDTDAQTLGAAGILEVITALKDDFSSKSDGVLTAINGIKSDFKDFSVRLGQAEDRIGDTEDEIAGHKTQITSLEKQVSELASKIDDLENRNRLSNLRLVNLPEKAEKVNAVAFVEKWLPDVLGPETFPGLLIKERAHRVPGALHSFASHDHEVLEFSRQDSSHAGTRARSCSKIMSCFSKTCPQNRIHLPCQIQAVS